MVPKVAGKGRSFKGAALYYLHDKGALTSGRVAFTYTENLPTNDPEKAIRCMAWTAMHQSEIKARAGGSARGRKLDLPVYTYSLSWAPGETPSREDMIAAALETLRSLGLERHETLMVSHNDEPHPHIHVIVNRVDPETGIAAPLSNDHLKLSTWAEAYEKAQGLIRCEERVRNNERRRRKEFVRDLASETAAEFHRWKHQRLEQRLAARAEEQKALNDAHKASRRALYENKEALIREDRERRRDLERPMWQQIYGRQRMERDRLKDAQRSIWSRLRYFLTTGAKQYLHADDKDRRGLLKLAFDAAVGGPRQFAEQAKKHEKERTGFAEKNKRRVIDAMRAINDSYRKELDALKKAQAQEAHDMAMRHSQESQEGAKSTKEGKDLEEFRRLRSGRRRKDIGKVAADITKPRRATKAFRRRQRDDRVTVRYGEIAKTAADITGAEKIARERAEREKRRRERSEHRREEFVREARDVTRQRRLRKAWQKRAKEDGRRTQLKEQAGDVTAAPLSKEEQNRRRKERAIARYNEIEQQGKDITAPKERAAGRENEETKKGDADKDRFTAFKDMRDEVTRDRGRDRSIERDPPGGDGPKPRPKPPKGPKWDR